MKNSKRIILRALPVLFMLVAMVFVASNSFVFADSPVGPNITVGGNEITNVTNLAGSLWKTIIVILQILAIAAIVIAGVRYMFASADAKADIKKQTVVLVIGAILVFGATSIATFIMNTTNDTLNTTP